MNLDTLTEVVDSRLQDFAERLDYLLSKGDFVNAEIIQNEWDFLLESYQNNVPFVTIVFPGKNPV